MAERRMFAKSIVLSDAFLEMPMSARCLYFTLGMLADDDGFIGGPRAIMRQCGATEDDLRILLAKRYVLGFESGIIVIKHWRMNNYLQNDRCKATNYLEEKQTLAIDERGAYTEKSLCIQDVYTGKDSIDKNSIDKNNIKHAFGEYNNVKLTDDERKKLEDEFGNAYAEELIRYLDEYIEMKGYKAKSHYLAIKKWVDNAVQERTKKARQIEKKELVVMNPTYDSSTNKDIDLSDLEDFRR